MSDGATEELKKNVSIFRPPTQCNSISREGPETVFFLGKRCTSLRVQEEQFFFYFLFVVREAAEDGGKQLKTGTAMAVVRALLVIVALLCARAAAATFGGGRSQHMTPRSVWVPRRGHLPISVQGSLRGGGREAGACRDIDAAAALLDKLRASSETPRDEFIALLQTCVRLSEAGDVQGALIYLRFLDRFSEAATVRTRALFCQADSSWCIAVFHCCL